jgi:hypothetical protein
MISLYFSSRGGLRLGSTRWDNLKRGGYEASRRDLGYVHPIHGSNIDLRYRFRRGTADSNADISYLGILCDLTPFNLGVSD